MEKIAIVNCEGIIERFIKKDRVTSDDIMAVELVLVYLPLDGKVALFYRGSGASDMHNYWVLQSGKVILDDMVNGEKTGIKLPLVAYRNAVIREFKEELAFNISVNKLSIIDQFYMEDGSKKLFFTLFSLELTNLEFKKMQPDFYELTKARLFTLEEFEKNERLGDAIKYKKDKIIDFLNKKFT